VKEKRDEVHSPGELPEAKISRARKSAFIWIVPIIAAGIAGWLVYKNIREFGPAITIRFADGKGIQAGRTMILYRGVPIGEVRSVKLTGDAQAVEIKARLQDSAAAFASEGSTFWVVRADVAVGSLRGLDTLVGGPYIQAQPGHGPRKKEFVGLEHGPVVTLPDGGLDITLTWPQLGWLNAGAPLYYRGVEVGVVQDYSLGNYATNIIIHAHIQSRFAPLVRTDSKFWNAGGIKADLGLFGVSVSAESLKSLLVGGIAFATPSPAGSPAHKDIVFPLYEKAEDKWLKWSPAIELGTETNSPAPPVKSGLESFRSVARANGE
jgi:paraquat-inducible protein B